METTWRRNAGDHILESLRLALRHCQWGRGLPQRRRAADLLRDPMTAVAVGFCPKRFSTLRCARTRLILVASLMVFASVHPAFAAASDTRKSLYRLGFAGYGPARFGDTRQAESVGQRLRSYALRSCGRGLDAASRSRARPRHDADPAWVTIRRRDRDHARAEHLGAEEKPSATAVPGTVRAVG